MQHTSSISTFFGCSYLWYAAVKILTRFFQISRECAQTDCPGMGICAINQTWAAHPGGWCMCHTAAGLVGAQCTDICANGAVQLFVNIFNVLLGIGTAAFCAYVGYRLFETTSEKITHQAILTLIFAGLGELFFGVWACVAMCVTTGFRSFAVPVLLQGRELRRVPQSSSTASFTLGILATCIGTCAVFILPIAWVSYIIYIRTHCRCFFTVCFSELELTILSYWG